MRKLTGYVSISRENCVYPTTYHHNTCLHCCSKSFIILELNKFLDVVKEKYINTESDDGVIIVIITCYVSSYYHLILF